MTTLEVLESHIKNLEAELAEAKAELARLRVPSPPKTLGDLYGFLAHAGDFSEEEIDAVLYRADEDLVKKLLGEAK
jgi:hypothetical protein